MTQTALNLGTTVTDTQNDVELRKVFKVFEGHTAVRGVDLNIRQGEFFSILGPSGCGKTTTLRLIAGFESPSAGEIMIRGVSMNQTPPYRRPVNTVFQSYALFNHLSVKDNIAFGLKIKRLGKTETEEKVAQALRLVKMEKFADRYPNQISGGQQQRVALARALVNRPAVLLLDEPLGALDLKLRKQMQMELSSLHRDLGVTFVMVTHDQEEAMSMSDRIAVMHEGRIEQIGSPQEIYERPESPFVADFIGETNLFQGRIEFIDHSNIVVETDRGIQIVVQQSTVSEEAKNGEIYVGASVVVSVRPEKIDLSLYSPDVSENCFEGRLINVMYMGTHVYYHVNLLSGDRMTVRQPNTEGTLPSADTPIYLYWAKQDCLALSETR
ncbi:MAG: ABC transporter ATP-binding protein [Okeania sp. SIO3B5]|uniref:ABC transporter ATP-binding protein n=1 Tax=Okeania sp. SIO3B5 TaxID=2607811 RepID=UPI0013FEBD08|nr:ABC transporter ATP-binding protein [Okeania sp. SIO3B5]NEO51687.1 ABC transporter ATP-binding protein [Okeania sp. SIO3B5]